MTNYLVTRHTGAVDWVRRRNIKTEWKPHLTVDDLVRIGVGDTVIRPLPIQVIASINARGGRYFHIEMDLPEDARRRELSADEMDHFGAEPVEYRAERV